MSLRSVDEKQPQRTVGLLYEAIIAGRFLLVGAIATIVHVATAVLLVGKLSVPALAGNTCAFCCAFLFSFCGHYFWTFSRPGKPHRALFRFLAVSLTTFLGNTALLALLLHNTAIPPVVSTVGSASLIPFISLLASRLWCFKAN